MVVVSNGTLLIVNGATGCIHFVELTEEVYAQVLAVHSPTSELIVEVAGRCER